MRSHAAGMGPPVEREVVRAMMLLRARTLAMGFSGALAQHDIVPLTRIAKEGLALINGTTGCSACSSSPRTLVALLRVADITAAMSVEALLGTDRAFDADLVALRCPSGWTDGAAPFILSRR